MCQLKTMSYQDYLNSEHWRELKKKKYGRKQIGKGRKCAFCGYKKNLEVHHLNYKNLYDVEKNDLRVTCSGCHRLIHILMKEGKLYLGKHLSPNGKYTKIKALLRYYKKQEKYKDLFFKYRNSRPAPLSGDSQDLKCARAR